MKSTHRIVKVVQYMIFKHLLKMLYLYPSKYMVKMKTAKGAAIKIIFLLITVFTAYSCNTIRYYRDCADTLDSTKRVNAFLQAEQEQIHEQLRRCEDQLQMSVKDGELLRSDTTRLGSLLIQERKRNDQLSQTNELLMKKNNELLVDNRLQTQRISTELLQTQEQLIRKEDTLKKLEADLTLMQQRLTEKEVNLNSLEQDLNSSRAKMDASLSNLETSQRALEKAERELAGKQSRLLELERVLAQKDSTVAALRKTVSDALLGFTGKGLKVEERNGKVYVSMENKLLFAVGSTAVGAEGQKALEEIAKVLEANPGINVLVEGHTDDQPLRGTGQMKDNWDLSVLRATEIVRIILSKGKIDPSRITAAGKSEYLPVDPSNTPEARAKNRRTEIILTPKLDELFKVIESN